LTSATLEVRTENLGTLRMTRDQLATLVARDDPATAVGDPGTGVAVQTQVRTAPGGPAWLPVELHFLARHELRAVTEVPA